MTTTTALRLATAVTLAALGGSAAVTLTGPASAQAHPRVLHFVAHDDQLTVDDLGEPSPDGPGLGDVLALTQTLTHQGARAGTIHNAAVVVDEHRHLSQASGTLVLAHGSIEFGGLVPQSPHFDLAVTGGTGVYTGAAGRVTLDFSTGKQLVSVTLVR